MEPKARLSLKRHELYAGLEQACRPAEFNDPADGEHHLYKRHEPENLTVGHSASSLV